MNYISEEELQTKLIELKSRMKWKHIVQLADFEGIAIGTLSNILAGRFPRDPILRENLRLAPHPECGHCWRFNKYVGIATHGTQPIKRKWRDYPTETLRLALKYREEI